MLSSPRRRCSSALERALHVEPQPQHVPVQRAVLPHRVVGEAADLGEVEHAGPQAARHGPAAFGAEIECEETGTHDGRPRAYVGSRPRPTAFGPCRLFRVTEHGVCPVRRPHRGTRCGHAGLGGNRCVSHYATRLWRPSIAGSAELHVGRGRARRIAHRARDMDGSDAAWCRHHGQEAIDAGRACCGSSRPGCRGRSCTRAAGCGCTPTTSTPAARIAAASTSAGSRPPPMPTTGPARPPTRVSATSGCANGQRFLLKDAVEAAGDLLLGKPIRWRARRAGTCSASSSTTWGRSRITCTRATSTRSGSAAAASPRRTTSLRSTTRPTTTIPTRSWASSPERRRTMSAAASRTGTGGTTASPTLSRAYRLERGTGWQIDPGILHAPGSLLTYEPQVNSDVFAMFQSEVEGRIIAVGPAGQGRAAGAAPRSRLHHRHARLGREREPAVRREQPLLSEAGEAVRARPKRRAIASSGSCYGTAGTRRRS